MSDYLRCYAEVDLNAIDNNIDEVRKKISHDTGIMAVVKADGYGHGSVEVAKKLEDKVTYFGVAALEEGIELREAAITKPILILGYTSPCQYEEAVQYDITMTIYNYERVVKLNETAEKLNKTAKIHIALDTGMTRIGFAVNEESIDIVEKISKLSNIEIEGLFSHFSCADMTDKSYSKMQMEKYDWFVDKLEQRNIMIPKKHLCNSAGIIEFDNHRFNMVRSGIITYGLLPSDEVNMSGFDIRPALVWKARIINVQTVNAGCGVSYGATFVTEKETKIATVSIGYADGYPRSLSNKGRVICKGKFAPIIGRVCMDQMMIDVSDIENVNVEDEVIVAGAGEGLEMPIEEVANLAGSFNYEFVCGISKRVKRIYL